MKKFQFKFESVLRVRKMHEEGALRALGAAQRALQAAKDHKTKLQTDLAHSLDRRESLANQDSTAVDFQVENDFITGTKQRIIQSDHLIFRANKAMEKALRQYLNARKQTKSMEVLKDKALEDHRREQRKLEEKKLNDIYLMRARVVGEAR